MDIKFILKMLFFGTALLIGLMRLYVSVVNIIISAQLGLKYWDFVLYALLDLVMVAIIMIYLIVTSKSHAKT